jgi:hypothetical protein
MTSHRVKRTPLGPFAELSLACVLCLFFSRGVLAQPTWALTGLYQLTRYLLNAPLTIPYNNPLHEI